MTRQCPRLVDRPGRGDELDQVRPSTIGANREAAADDLAQDRQVGPDAVELLRAARRDAESRDHLIEDQQRTRACSELAQPVKEAFDRRDHPHVRGHRFDDDGGDLALVRLELRRDRVEVVVGRDQSLRGDRWAHPGATWQRERRHA